MNSASPCSPSGPRCCPARTASVSKLAPVRSLSRRPASHSILITYTLRCGATAAPPPGIRESVVMQPDDFIDRIRLGLAQIVARLFDALQIGLVDIAGHIMAIENRTVELLDLDLAATHRVLEVLKILVDQPIGADQLGHFFGGAIVGNQLMGAGHVDAVHV